MIIESHWRKIKHDYLHRFNRPRVDLVIWVLLSRSIPDGLTRMQAPLQRDHRKVAACWRKDFKKEWKKMTGPSAKVREPIAMAAEAHIAAGPTAAKAQLKPLMDMIIAQPKQIEGLAKAMEELKSAHAQPMEELKKAHAAERGAGQAT
jgi:hypothetical protein